MQNLSLILFLFACGFGALAGWIAGFMSGVVHQKKASLRKDRQIPLNADCGNIATHRQSRGFWMPAAKEYG